MSFTRPAVPDLDGRTVVMAVRDQDEAAQARATIAAETPEARLELVGIDLGSQASVRAADEAILATHDQVDILVNNAGVMAMP